MRLWLALIVGKICTLISRLSKQGGGSSLPGVLARRIEPRILRRLLKRSAPRSVIITGTNGKTTTARIVAQILKRAGLSVVWNSSGANMMSGIVSALIEKCDVLGRLIADAAVFEVDEATLRQVVGDIRPEAIVVTNCFRDQLDRYGEVDTVLELIRVALKDMPAESTLILNADDPPQVRRHIPGEDILPARSERSARARAKPGGLGRNAVHSRHLHCNA